MVYQDKDGKESIYYFINNLQGTPIFIVDEEGTIIHRQQTDAWGNIEYAYSIFDDEWNYTGKKLDTVTGLYYFNQRWYDPELGRFLSFDPKMQFANPYLYCLNSPLNYIDPDGAFIPGLDILGAMILAGLVKDQLMKNPNMSPNDPSRPNRDILDYEPPNLMDRDINMGDYNLNIPLLDYNLNIFGIDINLGYGYNYNFLTGEGGFSGNYGGGLGSRVDEDYLRRLMSCRTGYYGDGGQFKSSVRDFVGDFRESLLGWHFNRNMYNDPERAKELQDDFHSRYHRYGKGNENNKKYLSPNKHHEAVYRNGQLVNSRLNRGTYNYGTNLFTHTIFDWFPYKLLGN